MRNRTNYHREWPTGSFKSVEEVLDLVIEARKTKRAIRIYTVCQSGHISVFYITSKTKLYRPGGKHPDPVFSIDNVNHVLYPTFHDHYRSGMWRSSKTNERWYKTHELLESYGIKTNYQTEHRMFTNKRAATEYSAKLKADPIYIEDVAEWHKYCHRMFGDY